jgi:hypothetical protein
MTKRMSLVGALALVAVTLLMVVPMRAQVIIDGKPVQVYSGSIRGEVTWTADRHWVLRGAVFVEEGATLNIQAGTRVVGEAGSAGTLVVMRGGRLNAIGTAQAPIVFTSDQAPGTRGRGDWGGIIINGRAPVNVPGGVAEGEGDTGIYGGDDPNDNSGSLRYVRVEFAGTEFSPDNELNGIAFQGVGRGGSYEYIQVHMNKDDGLEWFGGSADIKYALVSNAADDSFDWTFGWNGRGQFLAVVQRGDDADTGIEADNNEFNNELLPRSSPTLYNMTLCGDPTTRFGADSTRGVLLRRGTAGELRNFIVRGFKGVGLEVNGGSTIAQATQGHLRLSHWIIYGNLAGHAHAATLPLITGGTFPEMRLGEDAGIGDCFNLDAPDFQPTGVATLAGGQMAPAQPPNDGFFEPVTFVGAFPPKPAASWADGWTAFPQS